MLPENTKPPNKTSAPGRGHTSQRTLEERQAAVRRFQLIQEALQTSHSTTPPSGLPVISASSLTSPTSTPRLLRYRSQATQTSPSGARTTTDVKNSPTTVGVSSADEHRGGALAVATGNDIRDPILDGSDALDNRSIHGGLTSTKQPRRVVVILDSDEEESPSPPPPGQRPRPRTPSPSPSWEYAPMPGAFPATQYEMDWNSSPDEDEKDEDDFYV